MAPNANTKLAATPRAWNSIIAVPRRNPYPESSWNPKPVYEGETSVHAGSKRRKIQSAVLLSVIIEADGTPTDIRVERSLDSGLGNDAVEAVKRWQFKPAKKDGVRVAVSANVE